MRAAILALAFSAAVRLLSVSRLGFPRLAIPKPLNTMTRGPPPPAAPTTMSALASRSYWPASTNSPPRKVGSMVKKSIDR